MNSPAKVLPVPPPHSLPPISSGEPFLEWIDSSSGLLGSILLLGSGVMVFGVLAAISTPTSGASRSTRLVLEERRQVIETQVAAAAERPL